MIKVYIASPYRKGDIARNVKRQIDVADKLIENGFNPFIPLLFHFQHMIHPRQPYEWLKIDLDWVKTCDCLLRLDGESEGADEEVKYANAIGIPVFYISDDDNIDYDGIKSYIESHINEIVKVVPKVKPRPTKFRSIPDSKEPLKNG